MDSRNDDEDISEEAGGGGTMSIPINMKKILIIDDEKHICNVVKTVLSKEGFEAFCSRSGKDGLEKMYSVSPDLIILDILMPDMNGFEVWKRIRTDKIYRNMPILILTGQATEKKDELKGYGMGANFYLKKPFRKKELLARVKTILKRSEK